MISRQSNVFLAMIVGLVVLSVPSALSAGIEAITKPSSDVTLSFVRPGRIAEVLVKEGQSVKPGQLLVKQDDAAERAQLEQLEAQAKDTTRIKAAEAQLKQREVDLKKIRWAADRGAATELEVAHATLDVTIARLSKELAEFEHAQDERKYQEMKLHIERMRLTSPIEGTVKTISVEAGEAVDALEDVIQVVNIDPLWVDVHVPIAQAKALAVAQKAAVAFDGKEQDTAQGSVLYVSSVADAASQTVMVRIEVPNNPRRRAGGIVYVSFTDVVAETEKAPQAAGESISNQSTDRE